MPESDEVNAEEYNAEDDVPDPEAPGQPDDQQPPPAEDLPDDMEGLEDQEVWRRIGGPGGHPSFLFVDSFSMCLNFSTKRYHSLFI